SGVAGFDPLRLGQPQLVEEDLLQLFGRSEVELAAHQAVRFVDCLADCGGELGFQVPQVGEVGGDPRILYAGQHLGQGEFQVVEQVESFTPGELGVQGQGQLHRGQGSERQFAAGRVLVVAGPLDRKSVV